MTEEEILAMKAGRELDAAVAYYVMEADADSPADSVLLEGAKHYSIDISLAWQVVEHLGGLWDIKRRLRPHPDDPPMTEGKPAYQVTASLADYVKATNIHINERTGKSPWCWQLPEAICLAALLAKIAEVKP